MIRLLYCMRSRVEYQRQHNQLVDRTELIGGLDYRLELDITTRPLEHSRACAFLDVVILCSIGTGITRTDSTS